MKFPRPVTIVVKTVILVQALGITIVWLVINLLYWAKEW
jgi:hypothetical protein